MEPKSQATLARIWGEDQTQENVLAEFPSDPSADLPMAAEEPAEYGGKPRG
jgi:hypothetical protein